MAAMGADIDKEGLRVTARPSELTAMDVQVPSDISGAAFWLVAGAAHPNARVRVRGVGINPSRTGVLDVLNEMGANIRMENVREDANEPSADLIAESSDLRGIDIGGDIIPRVIDELPVLAMAASQASGRTTYQGRGGAPRQGIGPDFGYGGGVGRPRRDGARDGRRHDDRGRREAGRRGGGEPRRPPDSYGDGGGGPGGRRRDGHRRLGRRGRVLPFVLADAGCGEGMR